MRVVIVILFSCIIALPAFAQHSNLRHKIIAAHGVISLDSLSIVSNTFSITNVDTGAYTLDWVNALLTWKNSIGKDSVSISYRVFPQKLNAVAGNYSYDSIRNNFIPLNQNVNSNASNNALLNFGKLSYNGSFGRSISVGNNQDAVFNSQLNLQLSGYVGDSIQVNAAITDNNIPIQPDGTTQQLNEFDKVLLQFSKRNWELNLGDIDLRTDQSYFLKFYKRLQGLSYQQKYTISHNADGNLLLSGAIAKGKFARNIFEGQEGNQGPYRLQGNNNELFFIVLAGTEKVFINGVQLQRGEDQDYVINYNTAEVVFTPKQMITKDSRIQVEFEYADRNYLNSMLYISNTVNINKKLSVNVSAYSNSDAKNSPVDQTLDNPQKQFLSAIGDSISRAFYPSATLDTFSANKILYKKIDTVYNGIHDSIYIYSTSADSAKYSLAFTETGANRGNYIPLFNAANGKVFQWIAPLNGVPQGDYEPAEFLVTPKKQQVASVGVLYQLNKNTSIKTEFGYSNYDINTFSDKDKTDNKGYAAKMNLMHTDAWKTKSKKLQLQTNAGYEYVDKKFNPVERLRDPEFYRDWGLGLLPEQATEQLPSFTLQLSDDKNNSALYNFTTYLRSDGFKGFRNELNHHQTFNGFNVNNTFSLTNSSTGIDKGFYLKPSVDLNKTFSSIANYTIGAAYALEHNEQHNNITDTVTPLSFAFETISAYVRSDAGKSNRWSFTYFTRSDKLPYGKELVRTDRSHNYSLQTELLANQHHQFKLTATYRQLLVYKTIVSNETPDNSLLGRAEYYVNEWHGLLTGNALYEIGSGQEQRRDFSYIEVPAGTGQYAWIDYNNDGIEQLNEFEIAQFVDQAKFIRIYTPTNDYIKANYNQFNYNVTINPKAVADNISNKHFKNLITRFQLQSSLQIFRKQESSGSAEVNPFKGNIDDTSLINLNHVLSNTVSFNRYSTKWGLDVTNVNSYNKSLLTYGLETTKQNNWSFKTRYNIKTNYLLQLIQKINRNSLATPAFNNRNYNIYSFSTSPQFIYTSGTKFRVQTSYEYNHKANDISFGAEKAIINSLNIDAKYNAVSNTSLLAGLQFSNINFNGTPNTTVSYIMLDGLLPGRNVLWNINLTKRLVNNLEITVDYEGRKPAGTRTIHTGRASIRALL